ncbi:MAG TPA: SDR family oxidoreductase [Acidimicrobiia bacterium]|nr:SDR family oxidoreductase [Acidimicrobiia bacterium]
MDSFEGKLAVVTGGGTGMGRALVTQLAAEGCSVATCDVNADNVGETAVRAEKEAPASVRITTHLADVSDEAQMLRFRDEVAERHETDHIDLLFNNAGIGGGNSFVTGPREAWDKTFAVDWGGVYHSMRAFVGMVVASDDAYVVNTSSVNGFWASLGPGIPHTAYSAAKFAVKGFTEALIEDFRINAPHVKVAVVMPGHIGTDIVLNSRELLGVDLGEARTQMERRGLPTDGLSDTDIQNMMKMFGEMFRDSAPLTAEQAATIILDGVRAEKWRILVGDDAVGLDEAVRADPESAYGEDGLTLGTITGQ